MTNKEIKTVAMEILKVTGTTDVRKSDFTVKQAKQLIKEAKLGWSGAEAKAIADRVVF